MKLNILLLSLTGLLPISVPILLTGPRRYELIMTPMTWPVAQNYCRVMYTDLAIMLSDTDWLRFKEEATLKGLAASRAWVGLQNDINSWRWSLNDLPLKNVTYINWYPLEAGNIGGRRSCGILALNNQWCAVPCNLLRSFICYNANFSGANKFIGIPSPQLTWSGAQTYCRTYHTDLAISLNSSDDATLVQIKIKQGDSWLGLYRDTWKWSDGTIAVNATWAPGQPDYASNADNCAVVYNNMFYDDLCTNLRYVVCRTFYPTRGQIVRLQVKSDVSVFNPAVKSSILEQLKKKLEGNGLLENITVTWRVQPDGNIFHKKINQ